MERSNQILNDIKDFVAKSAERFGGKKRSELKDSDFLKSKAEDGDFTEVEDTEVESPEMELMEYKSDFYEMSLGSIKSIAIHAQAILDAIENGSIKDGLTESWLQGKIAVTEDYMLTIHNFLMYGESETDTEGSVAAKNLPGLWENIRKKKERMGKKYKPAKPGDKDRPDPQQWKKLTKANYEYECPKCGLTLEYNQKKAGYKCPKDGATMYLED